MTDPAKVVRGVLMTPYRVEFERRVKKVIVANEVGLTARVHAEHDLQDCTFDTSLDSGAVYSTMSADGPELTAVLRGPCRCGVTLNVTAYWPGYDLGKFFQMVTDDST